MESSIELGDRLCPAAEAAIMDIFNNVPHGSLETLVNVGGDRASAALFAGEVTSPKETSPDVYNHQGGDGEKLHSASLLSLHFCRSAVFIK